MSGHSIETAMKYGSPKTREKERAAEAIWTEDQFYLLPTIRQINEHSRAEAHIIHFHTKNGASYVDGMMDSADTCSPQRARQAVYSLARKGMIKRSNTGTGKRALYELTASVSVSV